MQDAGNLFRSIKSLAGLCSFFLIVISISGSAQEVSNLDATTTNLRPNLLVYIPNLAQNENNMMDAAYVPYNVKLINSEIPEYWVKFKVKNTIKQDQPFLLSTFYFDSLQLYREESGALIKIGNKNGYLIPPSERDFEHFHTSLVPFNPEYDIEETYYMKLFAPTYGAKTSSVTSFRIGFYVYGETGYAIHHQFPHYFNVFMLGALFLVIFYNIGIFIVLKNTAFGYLTLYNIAAMLWVICFGGYLIEPLGMADLSLERILRQVLSFPPLVICYLLLTINFLKVKDQSKPLYYAIVLFIVAIGYIIYSYLSNNFVQGNYIGTMLLPPCYLLPFYAAYISYKNKVKGSGFFLSATLIMIVAIVGMSAGYLADSFNYLLGHRIYQIAIFIEIIIFSLAGTQVVLAERKEKERLQLLYEAKEADIALRKKELTSLMDSILQKKREIASIKDVLRKNSSSNGENDSRIKSVEISINTDKEWDAFKANFDLLFTTFSEILVQSHPTLTQNDLRICALIKSGLKNKELAELQGISIKSIEKSKERIKKKMELDKDLALNDYLKQLDKV
jgi:DNA-binding CsgD family transcriptional regulator/AraC-like DNA-binding protein